MAFEGGKNLVRVAKLPQERLLMRLMPAIDESLDACLINYAQNLSPCLRLYLVGYIKSVIYLAEVFLKDLGVKPHRAVVVDRARTAGAGTLSVVEAVYQKSLSAPPGRGAREKKRLSRLRKPFLPWGGVLPLVFSSSERL